VIGHYAQPRPSNILLQRSLDSSVGIVMGYGLDDPGLIPGPVQGFSRLLRVQTNSGTQPACCQMRTEGSFLEDKAAGV
jgi:hypothetical protein